jgi:hypothetical protein
MKLDRLKCSNSGAERRALRIDRMVNESATLKSSHHKRKRWMKANARGFEAPNCFSTTKLNLKFQ